MRKRHPFLLPHGFGATPPAPAENYGVRAGEIFGLPARDFFELLGPVGAALGSLGTLVAYASGHPKMGATLGAGTAVATAVVVFTQGYVEKSEAYRRRRAQVALAGLYGWR